MNGECTKQYPKQFCNETTDLSNGYPQYRRRSPEQFGRVWQRQIKSSKYSIDNRWVVPYNPYLLMKYNAHVNVEICSTISAIKYLYKYVYKGHDRIMFQFQNENDNKENGIVIDEIKKYVDTIYISASEAIYIIFEFGLH